MSETWKVQVRLSDASKLEVTVPKEGTLLEVKQTIGPLLSPPADASALRIVFKGRILVDTDTLSAFGFEDGMTVHLVRSKTATTPSTATSASTGTTPSGTSFSQQPSSTSSTASTTPSPSPFTFPSPFGFPAMNRGTDNTNTDPMQQMAAQLMNDPETMNAIMNSPMMEALMSNPQSIMSMFNSNPTTRALLESNPELREALSDPSHIRQMMQAARNPALMAEMTRSTDRALANIESIPGGFQALRRMYETVGQPLQDGLEDMRNGLNGSNNNTSNNTPIQNQTGINNESLPNPWASPSANNNNPLMNNRTSPFGNLGLFPGMMGAASSGNRSTGTSGTPTANGSATNPSTNGTVPPSPVPNPFASMMGMGGLGGMGGMGGGLGGTNPQAAIGMMQDPGFQQMMTSMLSNPAFMSMMENSNPMLRQMLDSQPGMREMLRNPQFLQTMMNPQMMQAALAMQQSLGGQQGNNPFGGLGGFGGMGGGGFGNYGTTPSTGTANGTTPSTQQPTPTATQPDFNQMMQMFMGSGLGGGMGGGFGGTTAPPADTRPPAERFASQLQQMHDMGFTDDEQNIRALTATAGNVQFAIERILDGRV